MKTFTNPEHFAFTNNFNKSLLHSRITMMNRQSSWWSWWRYVAVGMALFFTVMCQPIVKSESNQENSAEVNGKEFIVTKTKNAGDTTIIESYKKGKLIDRTKVWDVDKHRASTWTGSMNQLLEASFFKRKQAMLYVRPDHHLDLYDEYKKSVTVFVDRKEVTLEELKTVHIRQVAIVYAHKRSKAQTMPGLSNHQANDTDYIVWIDRAPNRMKRDSTIHIVSPFYTGDF
ncbi:hypothetical protein [Runella sp.]|uniref:hypothetical protein n=1 Tax=Runella sp. TaxID=1960881 RepID=UPI003018F5E2